MPFIIDALFVSNLLSLFLGDLQPPSLSFVQSEPYSLVGSLAIELVK